MNTRVCLVSPKPPMLQRARRLKLDVVCVYTPEEFRNLPDDAVHDEITDWSGGLGDDGAHRLDPDVQRGDALRAGLRRVGRGATLRDSRSGTSGEVPVRV
jgi:hypothetical protein